MSMGKNCYHNRRRNNRLNMNRFVGSPDMCVEDLQRYQQKNMTPETRSLMSDSSNKMILSIYQNDHDLELISKRDFK